MAIANPSYPLLPTVWITVPVTDGFAAVLPGNRRVRRIQFERDQQSIGLERSGEENRAESTEGSDLENPSGSEGLGQDMEELALGFGNLDVWESPVSASASRGLQGGVREAEEARDIAVDVGPGGA